MSRSGKRCSRLRNKVGQRAHARLLARRASLGPRVPHDPPLSSMTQVLAALNPQRLEPPVPGFQAPAHPGPGPAPNRLLACEDAQPFGHAGSAATGHGGPPTLGLPERHPDPDPDLDSHSDGNGKEAITPAKKGRRSCAVGTQLSLLSLVRGLRAP